MRLFTGTLMFALVLILGNSRFLDAKTSDRHPWHPLRLIWERESGRTGTSLPSNWLRVP